MSSTRIMSGATSPSTSATLAAYKADRTYQATVTGTGAVTATVIIDGSNDDANFVPLGTITLSGTTTASDGFVSVANWAFIRSRLTAISGTGAAVSVQMGD